MKYKKKFVLWALSLLISASCFAQVTEIKGRVIDAKTKEPLSFANLKLKGTLTATTTDDDGFYYIRTLEKSDSLIVSYLGYPTQHYLILKGKKQEINIEMGSSTIEIKEVVVKKGKRKREIDTTANFIYWQVYHHKEQNKESKINSYKLNEYSKLQVGILNAKPSLINFFLFRPFKFVFDNVDSLESGDAYIRGILKEDLTEVYHRNNPEGDKRIIKATRFTGIDNPSIGGIMNYNFDKINVYDNIHLILGKSFLSPFATGAMGTYVYFVTDTQIKDGRTSFKLHFVGRSKVDLALKGYAWIDSATWAIREVNFRPNERTNMNYIKNYSIEQNYQIVDSSRWMLQNENIQAQAVLFKKKKRQTEILLQKHYERKNIETDIQIPDTFFNKIEIEYTDDDAYNKSRAWWDSTRFTPLNKFEEKIIYFHDTIPKVPAYKTYMWFGKLLASAYLDCGKFDLGRFYTFISRNNIEGWRVKLGGKTNFKLSRIWNLNGYLAYGLKDKDFKYLVDFQTMLPSQNNRWRRLELNYRYDMTMLGQENGLLTFDNFITIFRKTPLSKIMKTREWNAILENEWLKGFTTTFTLTQREYYRIPGVFDFNYKLPSGKIVSTPQIATYELSIDNRISLLSNFLRMGWYRMFTNSKYPTFEVRYQIGLLSIDGLNRDYHKLFLSVKQRLSWAAGYTKWELRGGAMFGAIAYPLANVTSGNFGVFLDTKNFNMLSEFEFVTDKYLQLYVEHHFDGFFFNKIPYFNRLQLREVLYTRMLWGDYSQKNKELLSASFPINSPYKIPYIEAGFGIENILKLLRVDCIWRCTYRNHAIAPNFAVKFTIAPKF